VNGCALEEARPKTSKERMTEMRRYVGGFTLIELLIVVAIIAILAAIAVPNFLEAQTRSKVSRVKSDMRSIATALEAYCVDYSNYPPEGDNWDINVSRLYMLTSPVAYMTSINLHDPFSPEGGQMDPSNSWYWKDTFTYATLYSYWFQGCYPAHASETRKAAILGSCGPDRYRDGIEHYPVWMIFPDTRGTIPSFRQPCDIVYDATNGTKSTGDIGRTVGDAGAGTLVY